MALDPELYRRPVRLASGVTLSAIDVRPERAQRTLVLLHGFGGSAAQWELILRHFGDRHRVIAPDLRGHGRSDKPPSRYTMEEQLQDLSETLDALDVKGPFVLWGHSFGGALAAEFAVRHPERAERLVLSSATGNYHVGDHITFFFQLPHQVLEGFRGLIHFFAKKSWNAPAHVLKPLYLDNLRKWRGWDVYKRVEVPTLVITGARDYLFSKRDLARVAQDIRTSEHVEVPASYHNVMLDRSAAVARAVERFIGHEVSWRSRAASGRGARPWLNHYEQGVPPTVAIPDQPLHRLLESAAQRHPRKVALSFGGGRIRYRRLLDLAQRFAGALRAHGLEPGDRVLLVLPNSPPSVFCYYGALMAGCTVVLGNPLTPPEELARQARDSGAKLAVVPTAMPRHAAALREAVPDVLHTRLADWAGFLARHLSRDPPVRGAPSLKAAVRAARPLVGVDAEPRSCAVLAYTSGTTEAPKGVMLSHRGIVANVLQLRAWLPASRDGREVFLAAVPLAHSYGMSACMNLCVSLAGDLVLLPRFEVREVLRVVRRHRVTMFPGVPPMYNALAQARRSRTALRSIRFCVSGAAPLPVEVQEGFERVTRARLVEGYGLTEAGPVTHANPLGGLRKTGSIGVPLPGTDAQAVDLDTGRACEPGEVGELLVKGPQVMMGYWNQPDATSDALTMDGWLRTGDLAVEDQDGYFTIVDRKKDMVVAGKTRVYPRDIEEVLYEHPKVFEAAVVGHPSDGSLGLKAFVVLKRGERCSPEELIAFCRRRLKEGLVPALVEFRAELPKSFVGKVLRRMLEPGEEEARSPEPAGRDAR